jgi:hypothetical protein
MHELVNSYKNKNVEFLFLNVWENDKPEKLNKKVETFLNENNYSFNVLLEYEDKVVGDYKIVGISTRMIINKKGNIVSLDPS